MSFISITAVEEHFAWLKNRSESLARYGEFVALGLLIVTVSLISIMWLKQDTRPQPLMDPYLRETFEFINRLEEQGGDQFWQSVVKLSLKGRSPLYQLLTVPFIFLFGRSEDAALSVNVLFEAVLLLSVYGIGRLAKNGKAGLLAALLVAAYPPIVNLSKLYRPDFALSACVALSLWLLLLLLKTRSVKIAWLFGASLGFGMLIRHFFVFHLTVPTAIFGLYMALLQTHPRRPSDLKETPTWLLTKLRDPFVLYGLLPAALIAAVLTASWYLTKAADPFFALYQRIQETDTTVTRGFQDVASYSFWWYALTMPGAISYVFTLLFAIGLVLGLVRRRLYTWVLVVTFLASYTVHSLQAGLAWKRFGAMLPSVAALTAVWIVDIRDRLLSTVLTIVCIVVATFNFLVVTWGVQPWSQPIAIALGSPQNLDTVAAGHSAATVTSSSLRFATCSSLINVAFCPNPPRDEDWRESDILQVILNDPECQEHRCYLAVIPRHEQFSVRLFDNYLARDFAKFPVKVGVWGATPLAGGYNNLDWLIYDYVVYTPQWPDYRYADAVTRFLESPPSVFDNVYQEVASFALPGGRTARLVKRTMGLTAEEAEAAIAALDLSEKETNLLLRQLDSRKARLNSLKIKELLDGGLVAEGFDLAMQALEGDTLTSEEKADLAVNVGRQLVRMGETTLTIELLTQVPPDTDNADVWFVLGRAYALEKEWAKSTLAYEQALAVDPQHYWANHLLAGSYASWGKWEAVVQLEQEALGSAPSDRDRVNSGVRLVEAYEELGNRDNACAMLQQVETWAEKGDERVEDLRTRLTCQK